MSVINVSEGRFSLYYFLIGVIVAFANLYFISHGKQIVDSGETLLAIVFVIMVFVWPFLLLVDISYLIFFGIGKLLMFLLFLLK